MEYKTRKEELFDSVFRAYQHDVYRISLYYSKNEHAATEITQKAFYNLYLHFENVKPECLRSYLYRTARNLTYNWIRDSKQVRDGNLDDLNEEDATIVSVEDIYIREEEQKIARELSHNILARLYEENKRWYEAITLVYYLGKSHTEVAEELGISKDVLCSRLYRAKKWIRAHYEEEYEEVLKRS